MWVKHHLKVPEEQSRYALIRVDPDGAANLAAYLSVAQLSGLLAGDDPLAVFTSKAYNDLCASMRDSTEAEGNSCAQSVPGSPS